VSVLLVTRVSVIMQHKSLELDHVNIPLQKLHFDETEQNGTNFNLILQFSSLKRQGSDGTIVPSHDSHTHTIH
jgi:hypothetical protein